MPGVVQTLQQLLSGTDQPPQLRLFVMQAATSESTSSLDTFADELSKWERPNRVPKLVALHARALATIGPAALTEEALARQKLRANKLASRDSASLPRWETSDFPRTCWFSMASCHGRAR